MIMMMMIIIEPALLYTAMQFLVVLNVDPKSKLYRMARKLSVDPDDEDDDDKGDGGDDDDNEHDEEDDDVDDETNLCRTMAGAGRPRLDARDHLIHRYMLCSIYWTILLINLLLMNGIFVDDWKFCCC